MDGGETWNLRLILEYRWKFMGLGNSEYLELMRKGRERVERRKEGAEWKNTPRYISMIEIPPILPGKLRPRSSSGLGVVTAKKSLCVCKVWLAHRRLRPPPRPGAPETNHLTTTVRWGNWYFYFFRRSVVDKKQLVGFDRPKPNSNPTKKQLRTCLGKMVGTS